MIFLSNDGTSYLKELSPKRVSFADLTDSNGTYSEPKTTIGYLAQVPYGKHIVMFYENPRKAMISKLWYLLHGLIQGEDGVLVTYNEDDTRHYLNQLGFDTAYYESRERKGIMRIREITRDPASHPNGLSEGIREMYAQIFDGVSRPCRLVATSVPLVDTIELAKLSIEVENHAQHAFQAIIEENSPYNIFNGFHGSVLCNYQVNEKTDQDWLKECSSNHHLVLWV